MSDLAELLGLEMEYVEKCPRQIISKKLSRTEYSPPSYVVVVSLGFYHDDADEIKIHRSSCFR